MFCLKNMLALHPSFKNEVFLNILSKRFYTALLSKVNKETMKIKNLATMLIGKNTYLFCFPLVD